MYSAELLQMAASDIVITIHYFKRFSGYLIKNQIHNVIKILEAVTENQIRHAIKSSEAATESVIENKIS